MPQNNPLERAPISRLQEEFKAVKGRISELEEASEWASDNLKYHKLRMEESPASQKSGKLRLRFEQTLRQYQQEHDDLQKKLEKARTTEADVKGLLEDDIPVLLEELDEKRKAITSANPDGKHGLIDDELIPIIAGLIKKLYLQCEQLNAQNDHLNAQAEKLSADGERLRVEGERLRVEGERLRVEGEKLKAQVEELTAQTEQLNTKADQLNTQLEQRNAQVEKLSAQVESHDAFVKALEAKGIGKSGREWEKDQNGQYRCRDNFELEKARIDDGYVRDPTVTDHQLVQDVLELLRKACPQPPSQLAPVFSLDKNCSVDVFLQAMRAGSNSLTAELSHILKSARMLMGIQPPRAKGANIIASSFPRTESEVSGWWKVEHLETRSPQTLDETLIEAISKALLASFDPDKLYDIWRRAGCVLEETPVDLALAYKVKNRPLLAVIYQDLTKYGLLCYACRKLLAKSHQMRPSETAVFESQVVRCAMLGNPFRRTSHKSTIGGMHVEDAVAESTLAPRLYALSPFFEGANAKQSITYTHTRN